MNIMDFNYLMYFNQYQWISTYLNFDSCADEYKRISTISIYSMYFNVYVRISTLKMCMFVFQRFNLFQQFQRISTLITVQMNIMDFNYLIYFNQYQWISTYFNFDYSAHEYERISPISIYFNVCVRISTLKMCMIGFQRFSLFQQFKRI